MSGSVVRGNTIFGNAIHSFRSRAADTYSKCALRHIGFLPNVLWRENTWLSFKWAESHLKAYFPSIWELIQSVSDRDCLSRWHESLSSNSSCFYNQTITSPEYRFLPHKKHIGNWFNATGLAVTMFHNLVTSQVVLPASEKLLAAPG